MVSNIALELIQGCAWQILATKFDVIYYRLYNIIP